MVGRYVIGIFMVYVLQIISTEVLLIISKSGTEKPNAPESSDWCVTPVSIAFYFLTKELAQEYDAIPVIVKSNTSTLANVINL